MLFTSSRIKGKLVCTVLTCVLVVFILYSIVITRTIKYNALNNQENLTQAKKEKLALTSLSVPLWEQTLDFEKLHFDNETGNPLGCYIVPNYIHFISLGGKPISFVQLICILAALKNQKPERIFFHYDDLKTFSGRFWNVLEQLEPFKEILVFNKIEAPNEIFGQPLSPDWKRWHGSDVLRIQTLMKYGGIYLDADCYLVKSIDKYRKFEMTLNWDQGQYLGSQTLIAHKDARFLKKYLETYKGYDKSQWYYNAGVKPTVEILYKQPELIHRVKVLFGADTKYGGKMFQQQWNGWREMYVVHLLANHQYLYKNLTKKATFPVEFNEVNIAYYDITFREMAYDVYDIANIKWPKNRLHNNV